MTVPWENWCRLCASPNGLIPILDPQRGSDVLCEKIKKYMSISVSEKENTPSLLCSKCCDQLSAFDNFVQRCMQVQAMFGTLCELGEDNIADDKLDQIMKQYILTDNEVSRNKSTSKSPAMGNFNQKEVLDDITGLPENKVRKKENDRKKHPSSKENCFRKVKHSFEKRGNECRKSERLKEIAEMKRAFGEEDQTFTDSLGSDFNEDAFENLLDSDDGFHHAIRNDQNGFKGKDVSKSIEDLSIVSNLKQIQSSDFSKDDKIAKSRNGNKCLKKDLTSKLQSPLCNTGLNCDVLSSNVNSSNVNSLSDADLNNFMCDDNAGNENAQQTILVGNNHSEAFKHNGDWKNQEDDDCMEPFNLSCEHQELDELDEMFHETGDDERGADADQWDVNQSTETKDGVNSKSSDKELFLFKCNQCDKSFHRKKLLNVHEMSHMPKDQQPYVCCKCARRFHCEALLRNHERVHLPNEEKLVFPCDVCSKKFSSKSAVTAHVKAIHFGERPFVCHLCGHSFSSKGILQDHITIHSDEEPWHCSKCTKKFKTKYRLRIHMDTHRETPYICPHCPVQLSTRRTLRMHLVVHRDTKAYQCSTCGKAFRRAKDLKNHQNLHTGRRPYTCPFCSRTFANGSNCRSHKRRMHPEELRQLEAALAGNGGTEAVANRATEQTDPRNSRNAMDSQDLEENANHSMKEDSQDTLLTEMALDLQQPQILTGKSNLTTVHEDPVVTAADLTLAPLVTLSSALPKLEPDDSRLVMNLTTQMHDTHDTMDAMSPLNLNIMSPMNLNMSSPLNLNISSPLNLNISSVLHSPTGRSHQQQPSVQHTMQHHQNSNRFQPLSHHQPQQQTHHLTLQAAQHQTHHQPQQHHQQLSHQPQLHQQLHQQQMPRSTNQIATLQTSLSASSSIHSLSPQTQLPAHLNNIVHHTPPTQNFVSLNQPGPLYSHHNPHNSHIQDSMSSGALISTPTLAHSMTTPSSTPLPSFASNPYVQHSVAYGRSSSM